MVPIGIWSNKGLHDIDWASLPKLKKKLRQSIDDGLGGRQPEFEASGPSAQVAAWSRTAECASARACSVDDPTSGSHGRVIFGDSGGDSNVAEVCLANS
jgi:hypothetical protein